MLLLSARVPTETESSTLSLKSRVTLMKGLFTEKWAGFMNGQGVARHPGWAGLGSSYHPTLGGRGARGGGGAPVRSCCLKGYTHRQVQALAEPNQKPKGKGPWWCIGTRLLETQSRSVKVTGFSGEKKIGDKWKNQCSNYRTLQRTEIINEETNHLPSVLQPKEICSLEELLVIFDPIIS